MKLIPFDNEMINHWSFPSRLDVVWFVAGGEKYSKIIKGIEVHFIRHDACLHEMTYNFTTKRGYFTGESCRSDDILTVKKSAEFEASLHIDLANSKIPFMEICHRKYVRPVQDFPKARRGYYYNDITENACYHKLENAYNFELENDYEYKRK